MRIRQAVQLAIALERQLTGGIGQIGREPFRFELHADRHRLVPRLHRQTEDADLASLRKKMARDRQPVGACADDRNLDLGTHDATHSGNWLGAASVMARDGNDRS